MSEIRVTNIIGETGTDAVNFTKGINVSSGVVTATTFSGSGASLTSLPAANLTGTLPAISGANLTGISAGAMTLLSTTSVSSEVSTVTISNAFNVYDVYMIVINGISPATDNRDFHAVVRDGNDITGDYSCSSYGVSGNAYTYGDSISAIRFQYDSVSHHLEGSWLREDFAMHMYMTGFPANKTWRYWGQSSYSHGSDVGRGQGFVGQCLRSAAIDAIKFYWQSGNFRPYGKIKLYGVS